MSQRSTQKVDIPVNESAEGNETTVEEKTPEVDETSNQDAKKARTLSEEAADFKEEAPKTADSSGSEEAADQSDKEPETLEALESKYQQMLAEKDEKLMRLAAEFENYKKRTAQETQTRIKFASQPLALNIISAMDNLERALSQAKEEENEHLKEFVRGVEMVQQQLFDALKQHHIERVDPKGEPFDPNKHEAMGVIETDDVEPDHIAEVFQAGYFLHDRVIRPAMVLVARKKSS